MFNYLYCYYSVVDLTMACHTKPIKKNQYNSSFSITSFLFAEGPYIFVVSYKNVYTYTLIGRHKNIPIFVIFSTSFTGTHSSTSG